MGSTEPPTGSSPPGGVPLVPPAPRPPPLLPRVDCRGMCFSSSYCSDVEETDVFRICLNEVASQFNVVAHEYRTDLVGQRGLLHVDLQERSQRRVHRGVA